MAGQPMIRRIWQSMYRYWIWGDGKQRKSASNILGPLWFPMMTREKNIASVKFGCSYLTAMLTYPGFLEELLLVVCSCTDTVVLQ